MPIRWKNVDKRGSSIKQPHHVVHLGTVATASTNVYRIFVAPQDCIVDRVNLYAGNSQSQNSGSYLRMELAVVGDASTTLQSNVTTTASGGGYDISPSVGPLAISPTSNNSLSRGTILILTVSAASAAFLTNVMVDTIWTPKDHANWSAVR